MHAAGWIQGQPQHALAATVLAETAKVVLREAMGLVGHDNNAQMQEVCAVGSKVTFGAPNGARGDTNMRGIAF